MQRPALPIWLFALLFVQISARGQSSYGDEIKNATSSFIQTLDPLSAPNISIAF